MDVAWDFMAALWRYLVRWVEVHTVRTVRWVRRNAVVLVLGVATGLSLGLSAMIADLDWAQLVLVLCAYGMGATTGAYMRGRADRPGRHERGTLADRDRVEP